MRWEEPGARAAFDEYFDTALSSTAHRDCLNAAIGKGGGSEWAGCARAGGTLRGLGLAVVIGDCSGAFDYYSLHYYSLLLLTPCPKGLSCHLRSPEHGSDISQHPGMLRRLEDVWDVVRRFWYQIRTNFDSGRKLIEKFHQSTQAFHIVSNSRIRDRISAARRKSEISA